MMRRPVKELFNYLIVEQKVPIDEIDNEGLNAVYIGIKTRIDRGKDTISESTKMLIKMGANCDLADR
jgi:UDP-3-O-[3-hydroxymyristoyl] glucosamine N-acyltransferase